MMIALDSAGVCQLNIMKLMVGVTLGLMCASLETGRGEGGGGGRRQLDKQTMIFHSPSCAASNEQVMERLLPFMLRAVRVQL